MMFNIHDIVKFEVEGNIDSKKHAWLNKEFGFFKFAEIGRPDCQITLADVDFKPDLVFYDYYSKKGEMFCINFLGKKVVLSVSNGLSDVRKIILDPSLDIDGVFFHFIEPLFFLKMLRKGFSFLHSSAVSQDDQALIFAAWPHTGKTEAILNFIRNSSFPKSYSFMADELVIISEKGLAYPYPRTIKLFPYNLSNYPELYNLVSRLGYSRVEEKMHLLTVLEKRRLLKKIIPTRMLRQLDNIRLDIKPEAMGWRVGSISKIRKLFFLQRVGSGKHVEIRKIEDLDRISSQLSLFLWWDREFLHKHIFAYKCIYPEKKDDVLRAYDLQKKITYKALRYAEIFSVNIPQGLPLKLSWENLTAYFK